MFAVGQLAFRKRWSTQRELSNEPKQSPLSRVQNRIRFFDPMVRGYQLSEASGGGTKTRMIAMKCGMFVIGMEENAVSNEEIAQRKKNAFLGHNLTAPSIDQLFISHWLIRTAPDANSDKHPHSDFQRYSHGEQPRPDSVYLGLGPYGIIHRWTSVSYREIPWNHRLIAVMLPGNSLGS